MKKFLKIIVALLFLSVIMVPITSSAATPTKYNKLVLVETWDGTWKAYDIEPDVKGFMLDAYSFATHLGFSVWNDSSKDTLTVERSHNRFITYTNNKEKYVYHSSKNKKSTYTGKYKNYEDKSTGKYYVHTSSLGKLGYYKYFEGKDKSGKYADYGYSSIFCFSLNNKITKLPNIDKVQTTCGLKWTDTFMTFDNIEEPKSTNILGVTFQAPESFVPPQNNSSWEENPEIASLIPKVMEITPRNSLSNIYAKYEMLQYAYNPSYTSSSYDFIVRSNLIGDNYRIVISGSLNDAKKHLLKAACYKISSTPETLYNVIVHDHNESAFLTTYEIKHFGDFSIQAYMNLGIASLLPSAIYIISPNEGNITKSIPVKSKQTNAASRNYLKYELELDHLDSLVDGKLHVRKDFTTYYGKSSGYSNAEYSMVSSNPDVLEVSFGGSKYGLTGKKKGTAILTTKKIQDGKHIIVDQTQVVVGEPRFYTRSLNVSLGPCLPELDYKSLLGLEYEKSEERYKYRPHDKSIIKKTGSYDIGPWEYDIYTAISYGTTKVDVIDIINGKEKLLDTFTVNVLKPELRARSEHITIKQSKINFLWGLIHIDYDYIIDELIYESENPSIISRKDKFVSEQTGTTKLDIYYKYKGKKIHLGTSKVTVIP